MKCGIRIFVTIALALTLGGSLGLAQEQDDFLQRYELALENLAASVASLPETSSIAREELDQAVNALRTLSRETDSAALISAMERIFERAREAIANQSSVDLAVQVEVLRGGFQRLVYDAALQSAIAGDLATARARLLAVAGDVGVPESTLAALADPDRTIAELRYALEVGVAASVQQRLQTAEEQASTDLDAAYRSLADAYGDYLLVQDSPRIPGAVNAGFVDAANALVDTQVEPLTTELGTLIERFGTLQNEAGDALDTAPSPADPSEPAELPATSTQQPEDAPAPDADTAQATIAQPEDAPGEATQEDVQPADGEASEAEAQEPTPEELAAQIVEQLAEQERQQQIDLLVTELEAAGIAESRRADLAAQLLDGGYTRIEEVVRDLYADASEAAGAVERGQPETARGFVRAYAERYRTFLAPLMATVAPETDVRTTALTSTIATVEGIRLQDVVVLSSQAGTLRDVLAGQEPTTAHRAAADTVRFWAGMLRLIVVIVLGVLAFVPLYLLNLAFGGGNRNWRQVGIALFFLLVPVMYEALAFVADLVAGLTGVDALYAVAQYSLFHNPVSQVVWAVLTGLAILLAIGGLYGICVQFGLLGRQSATHTTSTEVRDTVDWDEEF